ncbi:MAG: 50S ribosomal protein L3 [bacterium]|jgi:large subunit ribosomal protein L3|nr:50S ribosomal protein L3 [bacterium]
MSAILGRKLGMTTVFDDKGECIPVTVIEAGPCTVTQIKSKDRDGYEAVQLGFLEVKPGRVNRPESGHLKKAGAKPLRHLREFKSAILRSYELGAQVTCEIFQAGDKVKISGTSKGRGFTGVMKRHNFSGFKASHGVHESYRGSGSVGASSDPSRTFKNWRMAGQSGNARVTVSNLRVVMVDAERNLLLVKGAVPGARNGLLEIQK